MSILNLLKAKPDARLSEGWTLWYSIEMTHPTPIMFSFRGDVGNAAIRLRYQRYLPNEMPNTLDDAPNPQLMVKQPPHVSFSLSPRTRNNM